MKLTISEYAAKRGCTTANIRQLIRSGKIEAETIQGEFAKIDTDKYPVDMYVKTGRPIRKKVYNAFDGDILIHSGEFESKAKFRDWLVKQRVKHVCRLRIV